MKLFVKASRLIRANSYSRCFLAGKKIVVSKKLTGEYLGCVFGITKDCDITSIWPYDDGYCTLAMLQALIFKDTDTSVAVAVETEA